MTNYPCVFLTGSTYNEAKPAPISAIPPTKDNHPVSNSGRSVRFNTTKPITMIEKPSVFLYLVVIGSIFAIYCIGLLYVL